MQYIIETERLYLRELNITDSQKFFELNLNPNVIKYTEDKAFKNKEEALSFLENYKDYKENGYGRWAAIDKSSNVFIGWCGLKYNKSEKITDIGFRFFEEEWNKGYATESALACIEYGFKQLKLNTIIGRAMKENSASIKVLEKVGLSFIDDITIDGKEWATFQIVCTKQNI